ncbi:hydroxyethylthiazole kinase, partial [Acinetobacter baumannii]|nr:hydroxyethylthiazole kinase [Acinetobacter baumannii]
MLTNFLTQVRQRQPLVHCITNYITANDCANLLLACGASPIMADDPEEAAEITAHADALVLNLG